MVEVEPPPEGVKAYTRVGLTTYVQTSYALENLPEEALLALMESRLPQSRIAKLREQVKMLGIAQLAEELDFIEVILADGKLRALGKKDPLNFALNALDRLIAIAETEQYFQTLAKYNDTATSRRAALLNNRMQASQFPPGSAEDRDLVRRFGLLADKKKPIKNIPGLIYRELSKANDGASLMSIRRALQRLELIPKATLQKQK